MKGKYDLSSFTNTNAGASVIKGLKKVLLFPVACLNTIVSLVLFWALLFVTAIPLRLYKKLVLMLSKVVLPGSRMLPDLDNVVAHGSIYKSTGLYISLQLNFEGRMDYEGFLEQWENNVMQLKTPEGDLKFPELKCYIQSWMGYSFYRTDEKFQLRNHIKVYENPDPELGSMLDREKVDKIRTEFTDRVFEDKRSPWEVLILHNCRNMEDEKDEKEFSVVVLKIHHALGDGYAVLLLFWEAFSKQSLKVLHTPRAASLKKSFLQKIRSILSAVCHVLVYMMRPSFLYVFDQDKLFEKSAWHDNRHKSDMIAAALKPIEGSSIKEISRRYNVSVTAVLIAVCTGGFRRMMTAKGFPAPDMIHSSFSLALPNHPPRLTTHSFISEVEVPISNLNDRKRLQLISKNFKIGVRMSLVAGAHITKLFLLPIPWSLEKLSNVNKMKPCDTMTLSTVPIPMPNPPSGVEILGCRLAQVFNSCDFSFIQNVSLSVFYLKYKGQFFVHFGVQRYLIKDDREVYEMEKYMLEEVNHLLRDLSIV